jgi:hypothetical protein
MPLAKVIDADSYEIAPIPQQDFSHLLSKMDAQNIFIAQGFEHLIKKDQATDDRLAKLEQYIAQPIVKYQQPVQDSQTAIALSQMAIAMQRLADKPSMPTTVNHFVDQSQHTDSHHVEIQGNNYGAICTDGTQRTGMNPFFFILAMVGTIIIGVKLTG